MLYLSAFSISLNQIKSPRNPSFSSHLPPLPPECTQPPNKFPFLGNGCACRPVAWLQGDLLVPPSGSAQGLEKCGMEKKDSFPFEQNAVWALLEMNDAEGS